MPYQVVSRKNQHRVDYIAMFGTQHEYLFSPGVIRESSLLYIAPPCEAANSFGSIMMSSALIWNIGTES